MKHVATVACEKVIIDNNGAHSLIQLMSNAEVGAFAPPGQAVEPMPFNAVIPKEWYVFSMWSPLAEEANKKFEQTTQVFWPNGDKFTEGKVEFKTDEKAQYNTTRLLGFPAGQVGNVRIVVWVEREGRRITDMVEYVLVIKHAPLIVGTPVPTT